MLIPKSQWIKYKNKLAAISQKAADEMEKFIQSNPEMDSDELIGLANALEEWYGDAAAELACEMYDAAAEAQKASVPPAEPAEPSTFQEVAKAVNGARKRSDAMVPDTVGRLVKQRAADTTLKNAQRDGAFFAWVPQGDTCPYCMALAGIGWQRAGKKTLKGNHAEHIHANCDCAYVVDFKGDLKVEGYDPDEYDRKIRELTKDGPDGEYGAEDLLRAAGHNAKGSSYDAINQIRRQQYAADPEKYRAQKRAAYARNKINYDGVPKTWEKNLVGSDDDMLKGTNPNYIRGLPETARKEQRDYNDNCTNCVVAYEMRCRGYDVTAQPLSANKKLRSSPFSAWMDGEKRRFTSDNTDDLMNYMESMPEGARVQIALSYKKTVWSQRNGHTCIVEKKNGINIFKDPQNGAIIKNTEDLFDGLERISYLRIDDKEITDRGISACRRRV